ncbi:hypothetical protein ES705_46399 [subsurface metagenome]
MSDKRYTKKCKQCGRDFIARSIKGIYCSDHCRNTAGRERRGHVPYVPTGRPPGRPRKNTKKAAHVPRPVGRPNKDPASSPIPVREDDLKNYKEFKALVRKSMDLPPDDKESYGPGKQGKITSGFFKGCTWDEMEDIVKFQKTGKIGG